MCAIAATIAIAVAPANAATGNVTTKYFVEPTVQMTLTPNYASGFGSVLATFGTQPTPAHGPDASQGGGAVDFGPVLAGNDYLYKFAAHLNVTTNDLNGFNVYAEGSADFTNQGDGSSATLSRTLYYLNSTSGSSDSNTGFSPSTPFQRTAGVVSGGSFNSPPTITYSTFPAPAETTTSDTADFFFDYQLKVPPTATNGNYFVWIVYTVVPK